MFKSKGWLFTAVLALALAAPDWASAQTSFRRIVVFGTSLSDPGNAFALVGGTSTPPDYAFDPTPGVYLVPTQPYARGGHHFSNGATWIEQFARPLGLAGSVRPAFHGSAGATNFAVGGARANDVTSPFGLSGQVSAFLAALGEGNQAPSDALYVIEMGGNDLRDALAALRDDPTFVTSFDILNDAAGSIRSNVVRLRDRGARKFLVWTAPNIGVIPAVTALGASAAAAANFLTAAVFNPALVGQLTAVSGIEITWLDVYTKLNQIVAPPNPGAAFGLTNVTDACIQPKVPPFECKNPDEYLFWDGIHPTTAVHGIIAQQAATTLGR